MNFGAKVPCGTYNVFTMIIQKHDQDEDLYTINLNSDELDVLKELCFHGTSYLQEEIYQCERTSAASGRDKNESAKLLELLTYYKTAGEFLGYTLSQEAGKDSFLKRVEGITQKQNNAN